MHPSQLLKIAGVLVLGCSVALQVPVRASSSCGDVYNQGGCGCSGWITIDLPGYSWCDVDMEQCAAEACDQECGFADVGWLGECDFNEWSAWFGFKCNAFWPCPE
jgi:hypothetical protein